MLIPGDRVARALSKVTGIAAASSPSWPLIRAEGCVASRARSSAGIALVRRGAGSRSRSASRCATCSSLAAGPSMAKIIVETEVAGRSKNLVSSYDCFGALDLHIVAGESTPVTAPSIVMRVKFIERHAPVAVGRVGTPRPRNHPSRRRMRTPIVSGLRRQFPICTDLSLSSTSAVTCRCS